MQGVDIGQVPPDMTNIETDSKHTLYGSLSKYLIYDSKLHFYNIVEMLLTILFLLLVLSIIMSSIYKSLLHLLQRYRWNRFKSKSKTVLSFLWPTDQHIYHQ